MRPAKVALGSHLTPSPFQGEKTARWADEGLTGLSVRYVSAVLEAQSTSGIEKN